jgi:four helix bundle protein
MQDHRKLDVWEKAHELAVRVYTETQQLSGRPFPGLTAQMRRAASSIPANIAEGCGHDSQRELARFLQHALASAHELQYHLLLAKDVQLLPSASYARMDARAVQVSQMLGGLLRKVRAQVKPLPVRQRSSPT